MMTAEMNCRTCRNRCDGRSLGVYRFEDDLRFSKQYENELIQEICAAGFYAREPENVHYPDVVVMTPDRQEVLGYIEVKVQRRSFMSVTKILPESDLVPPLTMALNRSDLVRYFEISDQILPPVYILWVLSERPCIVPNGETKRFIARTDELRPVYEKYRDKRTFRRASGNGDVVNGQHKGVVVNYHFSLNELRPFSLSEIVNEMVKIKEEKIPF